jgi:hypothetical protein
VVYDIYHRPFYPGKFKNLEKKSKALNPKAPKNFKLWLKHFPTLQVGFASGKLAHIAMSVKELSETGSKRGFPFQGFMGRF